MSALARIGVFVVALAALFGAGWGIGGAVDPIATEPPKAEHADGGGHGADGTDPGHGEDGGQGEDGDDAGHADHSEAGTAEAAPAGLQATQAGYTLHLMTPRPAAGTSRLAFHVLGPDGEPVTAYDVQHEKELHLIAVRRDFSGYQHLHPTRDADGLWHTPIRLEPGQWRVFADTKPSGGPAITLGGDVAVPGHYEPALPRAATAVAHVDGYTVRLKGRLTDGASTLTPQVLRDGVDVTDELQPYLGALGHLVALRQSDLAYLHVHPEGLTFHTEVPTAGTYEMFLDFKHQGVVRTARFTLSTDGSGQGTSSTTGGDGHDHAH